MKKALLILIVVWVGLCHQQAWAQKINLEAWAKRQKDSLTRNGVDTLMYYHHYCGECAVIEQKEHKNCEVLDNDWTFIDSYYIFKKNGAFYSLKFNYCNSPVITKLASSKSIPYFLSIKAVLHNRDLTYAQMRKQAKFFPPIPTDGSYEEATLYIRKQTSKSSISEYQKKDGYKYWKKYPWIDKEIALMKLVEQDLN